MPAVIYIYSAVILIAASMWDNLLLHQYGSSPLLETTQLAMNINGYGIHREYNNMQAICDMKLRL